MKRITVFFTIWVAMLLCGGACALAAEAAPAVEHVASETASDAAGHEGVGHEAPGELIPISKEALKQAFVQAVWVVIIFLIVLAILYPTAWKGVLNGLKAREQRIRKEITDAEAARLKAEQTLSDYTRQLATAEQRVRDMLAKAHSDGESLAAKIREGAGREAEAIKTKALADIEDARKNAVLQVHSEAAEMSTAIAEKIIRRSLNVDDQRELVRASLEQLESGNRN